MKLYRVPDNYINYLWSIDCNVQKNNGERMYIGVVLEVEGVKYFAPLSSPKPNDYDNRGKVKKNSTALHRIVKDKGTDKEDFLGKIKFTSMIPVREDILIEVDIDSFHDLKYKNMLNKQIYYINGKKEKFSRDANIIYNDKINGNTYKFYYPFIVDFKKLEAGMKNYS